MCAGACYELGSAMARQNSASSRAFVWIGLVWHTGFIIASSVMVVFGAADAQAYRGAASDNFVDRKLTRLSLIFTIVISITFAISHYLTLE